MAEGVVATSLSAAENSRYPSIARICAACSYGVRGRSPYSFATVGSAMPSCSATYRQAAGATTGSDTRQRQACQAITAVQEISRMLKNA